MVDIVVAVLTVASDAEEVRDGIEVRPEIVHVIIGIKVGGICLLHALDMEVDDVGLTVDQAHLDHFGDTHLAEFFIGHRPHPVALIAEVFKTHPDGVSDLLDHIRRPVVVDLKAPHMYALIVNIDPVIGHDIAHGLGFGFIFKVQVRDQHADGHVVAVRQTGCDRGDILRNIIHALDQILDRHRADDIVAVDLDLFAVLDVDEPLEGVIGILDDTRNLGVLDDGAAHLLKIGGGQLPQLTGAPGPSFG